MRFNYPIILNLLGLLLVLNGLFMLLCLPVSVLYDDGTVLSFLMAGGVTLLVGANLWIFTRNTTNKALRKRDGFLIVTLGWVSMILFGSLPYLISGSIPNYTDAFFETTSGFTTTGATILDNIEAMPKGILFWRSLTQWIGGMGIIVLAVAVLPGRRGRVCENCTRCDRRLHRLRLRAGRRSHGDDRRNRSNPYRLLPEAFWNRRVSTA